MDVNLTEDRLAQIIRLQREFQEDILGHGDLTRMHLTDRAADYFRTQAFALVAELGEASNEIGWKPWATARFLHHKRYRKELIDALHFLVNLMLLDGMTAEDIYSGYIEKQIINRQRQANGYDGITGKCAGCGRAFDDNGVLCTANHCDAKRSCSNCLARYGDPGTLCVPPSPAEPLGWCNTSKAHLPLRQGSL